MDSNCTINSRPKSIKEFFKSWYFWKPFLAIITGGLAGFLYYYFVGCTSGTCPITSTPYGSIIAGGLFGFFLISSPCSRCR
jgi:hypothetical protein